MKIKKGLFITEIEINPEELRDLWNVTPRPLLFALLEWMKKYLDFKLPKVNKKK